MGRPAGNSAPLEGAIGRAPLGIPLDFIKRGLMFRCSGTLIPPEIIVNFLAVNDSDVNL
jgi:hypothetical protein